LRWRQHAGSSKSVFRRPDRVKRVRSGGIVYTPIVSHPLFSVPLENEHMAVADRS
jgi:hypothetical protein